MWERAADAVIGARMPVLRAGRLSRPVQGCVRSTEYNDGHAVVICHANADACYGSSSSSVKAGKEEWPVPVFKENNRHVVRGRYAVLWFDILLIRERKATCFLMLVKKKKKKKKGSGIPNEAVWLYRWN